MASRTAQRSVVEKRTVARALEEISRYLEISERNRFKSLAFRNAARRIEGVSGSMEDFVESGEVHRTPGIGKAIGPVIVDLVRTGRARYLEELRAQYPAGILELVRIPGLGLKKIGQVYSTLGVSTIDELEAACAVHKIAALPGFGPKTEQKILVGIAFARKNTQQFLLPAPLQLAEKIVEQARLLDAVLRAEVTGKVRRRMEIVSSVEILVAGKAVGATISALLRIDLLQDARPGPNTIHAGSLSGIPIEIRVVRSEEFATALLFDTGAEEFIDRLTEQAEKKGFDLTREALRKHGKQVPTSDEKEIFENLGVALPPPELREAGVVLSRRQSRLVALEDLQGTFHVHTTYSDGRSTLHEMLDAARERRFSYVGISDHSKTAAYARGLTEDRLVEQHAEIEKYKPLFAPMRIFKGTEADILPSGKIDYADPTLATFDFVIASVHSRFKMSKEEMTSRLLLALENPYVTFLGHLTGRMLLSREGYSLDFDVVFEAAARNDVMIEINGNPHRLELDWRLIGLAREAGVRFSIHPDAHSVENLDHVASGLSVARKGGLTAGDIFNTQSDIAIEEYFRRRKARARNRSLSLRSHIRE